MAPLPTFLRKEPRSFNFKQPGTAFYLGLGLRSALDTKVLEFVDSCPSMVKSALGSVLNPWFTASASRAAIRKEVPKAVALAAAALDTAGNSRHRLGAFDPAAVTPPIRPPEKVVEVAARVVLLHPAASTRATQGLLQFDLEVRGAKEPCLALFTLDSLAIEQRAFGDLATVVSVGGEEELVFNAKLMSENSKVICLHHFTISPFHHFTISCQVPYLATAVWRAREGRPKGRDLTSLTEGQVRQLHLHLPGLNIYLLCR